jgi:hypothetical protein
MKNNIFYYEISFLPDESISYAIKTEIPPEKITPAGALSILFDGGADDLIKLKKDFNRVLHISEYEALSFFDVAGLVRRVSGPFGVYYKRG